jgi:hypothetical protein
MSNQGVCGGVVDMSAHMCRCVYTAVSADICKHVNRCVCRDVCVCTQEQLRSMVRSSFFLPAWQVFQGAG